MADNQVPNNATEMDYPQHESSYERFLGMLKWSVPVIVVIAVAVVMIIAI